MPFAFLEVAAVVGIFAVIVWLGRQAFAIADAVSDWQWRKRTEHLWNQGPQGRSIDDRRPRDPGVIDVPFEEVK
jgi:hypothetical protein